MTRRDPVWGSGIHTGRGGAAHLLGRAAPPAVLVVLVALVQLCNLLLGRLPSFYGEPLTLQRLLGFVMAPVAWLMGIPWEEAALSGSLMGTKTVLNEFLAYVDLSKLPQDALSERSRLIMTYAMCGFANFGSIAVTIGGISGLAPERRKDFATCGFRSMIGGALAAFMTASIAGMLI